MIKSKIRNCELRLKFCYKFKAGFDRADAMFILNIERTRDKFANPKKSSSSVCIRKTLKVMFRMAVGTL